MKIPVYIISSSIPSRKEELVCFFKKNKLFKVIELCCSGLIGSDDFIAENKQVIAALEDCLKKYRNNYCLIIKDSSLTASTPKKVAKIIKRGINLNKLVLNNDKNKCSYVSSCSETEKSYSSSWITEKSLSETGSSSWVTEKSCSETGESCSSESGESCSETDDCECECDCEWDLFYLCKWLDRCDLYKTCTKVKNLTRIVKTESPLGLQAIVFSPSGRDMVLGKKKMRNCEYFPPILLPLGDQLNLAIEDKAMKAITVTPNLFEYDVLLSKFTTDLLKLCECRLPEEIEEEEDNQGIIPLIWFIIVVVGVILLAWIFYQRIAKYEVIDIKETTRVTRK